MVVLSHSDQDSGYTVLGGLELLNPLVKDPKEKHITIV